MHLLFLIHLQLFLLSLLREQSNPTRYHTKQVLSLYESPNTIVVKPSIVDECVVVLKSKTLKAPS